MISRLLNRKILALREYIQFDLLLTEGLFAKFIPKIGIFDSNTFIMNKNTSISLGNYFDQFVQDRILEGRFKNVSEVIRAGLRLLEEEENKARLLRNAIQEGIDSGIADDFDPQNHLESLKAKNRLRGEV